MAPLLVILPFLLIALWLASIRPYCLRHRQGYTTGANWGVTSWVDWQQATEIAKKAGDRWMIAICRTFLLLQIAFVAMFAWLVWHGV